MIQRTESITRELKILNNKIKRAADASIPPDLKQDITQMQSRILIFLSHRKGQDIFQRDVEAEFSITRATASKILTSMERGGLITRSAVESDARLKKLGLTEKADIISEKMRQNMIRFEESLTWNLTAEERKTLLTLLRKLERNLDGTEGGRLC